MNNNYIQACTHLQQLSNTMHTMYNVLSVKALPPFPISSPFLSIVDTNAIVFVYYERLHLIIEALLPYFQRILIRGYSLDPYNTTIDITKDCPKMYVPQRNKLPNCCGQPRSKDSAVSYSVNKNYYYCQWKYM